MPRPKKAPSFEKDLESLEEIVSALEEGGLSLDDSLKRFEEGIGLAGKCEKALRAAEKKIEILSKNAQGELEAKPFEGEEPQEPPGTPEAPRPESFSDGSPLPEEAPEAEDDEGSLLF